MPNHEGYPEEWLHGTLHMTPTMSDIHGDGPDGPEILCMIAALKSDLRYALENAESAHKELTQYYAEYGELDDGERVKMRVGNNPDLLAEVLTSLVNNRLREDLGRDSLQPDIARCLQECLDDPPVVEERLTWRGAEWSLWRGKF